MLLTSLRLLCVLLISMKVMAFLDLKDLAMMYDLRITTVPFGFEKDPENGIESPIPILKEDNSKDTPQIVTNRGGQKFRCNVPSITLSGSSAESETSVNPATAGALLSKYLTECFTSKTGWWQYTLCRGKQIQQIHGQIADSDYVVNSLGIFSGRFSLPEFSRSTRERELYVMENYEMGTMCDVVGIEGTQKQRRTTVKYLCDGRLRDKEAYIESVEENASCEYTITVRTGALCSLPHFVSPSDADLSVSVTCSPLLNDDDKLEYTEKMKEKREMILEAKERREELLAELGASQRRKAALMRTQLLKNVQENVSLKRQLIMDHSALVFEQMFNAHIAREGEVPSAAQSDSIYAIVDLMDDVDGFTMEFMSTEDEDRANVYHYFHDPEWRASYPFPLPLDYVDAMNGYFTDVRDHYVKKGFTEGLATKKAMEHDPTNWRTNIFRDNAYMRRTIDSYRVDPDWMIAGDEVMVGVKNRLSQQNKINFLFDHISKSLAEYLRTNLLAGRDVRERSHAREVILESVAASFAIRKLTPFIEAEEREITTADLSLKLVKHLLLVVEQVQIELQMQHPEGTLPFTAPYTQQQAEMVLQAKGDLSAYYALASHTSSHLDEEIAEYLERRSEEMLKTAYASYWDLVKWDYIHERREKLGKSKLPFLGQAMPTLLFKEVADAKKIISLLADAGMETSDMRLQLRVYDENGVMKESVGSDASAIIDEWLEKQMQEAREQEKARARADAYKYVYEG